MSEPLRQTSPGPAPEPVLPLDTLLEELHLDRADVRATHGRGHALLRAVLSIGSELDLTVVLTRLTEAAVEVADAQYAALGVLEPAGLVAPFLQVGFDAQTQARIGRTPRGEGILGLLVREPRALRLEDLGAHPDSVGFPPGHPPMRSFLGVPIRIRDQVFGNLYLTEKRGGVPFDATDEAMVTALAAAAGVAIENARMYDASRRREGWLQAAADISTLLLSGTDPEEVLALIAGRSRSLLDAETAFIALPAGTGRLLVETADGDAASEVLGRSIPVGLLRSLTAAPDGAGSQPVFLAEEAASAFVPGGNARSALLAPIGPPGAQQGVLALFQRMGMPLAPWTLPELRAFAAQASVALEVAERRRDAEKLVVYADRDRIARDLHDLVIQRLFATGMHLESIARTVSPADAAARMRRCVDDLDGTIREIRSTIYALHSYAHGGPSLRSRLLEELDAATEQLGFSPDLRLSGLLDVRVPPEVGEHLLAVLREGLSNVARHAGASAVQVRVEVGPEVALTIRDDGRGLGDSTRRSGLAHLDDRARGLDGRFAVRTHPDGGTVLTWSAPIGDGDDLAPRGVPGHRGAAVPPQATAEDPSRPVRT